MSPTETRETRETRIVPTNTRGRPYRRRPDYGRAYVTTSLRFDPEIYRAMVEAADRAEMSINAWVERAVDDRSRQELSG